MRAMRLEQPAPIVQRPLVAREIERPTAGPGELVLRVSACAVCRTDLQLCEGDVPSHKLPITPGHQVIGTVEEVGAGVADWSPGERAGVAWLGYACGVCVYCRSGRENLCDLARFTGYDVDGGYAEWVVADERYCFPLPDGYDDLQAAPLLCAGLIGYRSFRMTGDAERLGLYGFGAAAHIIAQAARADGRRVFAVTREGDTDSQEFARSLGAEWAGSGPPPEELDAAIVFAPVGELVPAALRALAKGGTVVCAGIHMSEIPSFPYEILWGERSVRSVANLTRQDALDLLALAPSAGGARAACGSSSSCRRRSARESRTPHPVRRGGRAGRRRGSGRTASTGRLRESGQRWPWRLIITGRARSSRGHRPRGVQRGRRSPLRAGTSAPRFGCRPTVRARAGRGHPAA